MGACGSTATNKHNNINNGHAELASTTQNPNNNTNHLSISRQSIAASNAATNNTNTLTSTNTCNTDRAIIGKVKGDETQPKACIKLLLLGASECGKSTILKQMKILHKGYTLQEKQEQIEIVYTNILQSIHALIQATEDLRIPITDPHHQRCAAHITALDQLFPNTEIAHMIYTLCTQDESIQQVLNRCNEFDLLDGAMYFLSNIHRLLSADYLPTESDILRTRLPTNGIIESEFIIDELSFKFYDVGGQRGERKKWIHCFDQIHAILFIASLNDYDLMLSEDNSRNRLLESLSLFEGILSLPWFKSTSIILFLNKNDLFMEKIKRVDISLFFSDYNGKNGNDYEEALEYIKELFFTKNQNPNKTIYAHVTDATDTQQIEFVWKATKQIIMQQNLIRSGLIA